MLEKACSILCNTENAKMATGQTENFPVHSKYHHPACFAKNRRKKSSKSFLRLTASCAAGGSELFNFHAVSVV
jgi:hypothetical protein